MFSMYARRPRLYIFCVFVSLLCFRLTVGILTCVGLNLTAIHVIGSLLIGYSVMYIVIAPAGLWGIFGASQNNALLCSRYVRDHWFVTGILTIIEVIKLAFAFALENQTIQTCVSSSDGSDSALADCGDRVHLSQKVGIILLCIQEIALIGSGYVVYFSVRRINEIATEKQGGTPAIPDLEAQIPRSDVVSITSIELEKEREGLDSIHLATHPPSPFGHRPKVENSDEGSEVDSSPLSILQPSPNKKTPEIQRVDPPLNSSIRGEENQSLPPPRQIIQAPRLVRKRSNTFGDKRNAAPLDPKPVVTATPIVNTSFVASSITVKNPAASRTPPPPLVPNHSRPTKEELYRLASNEQFVPGHKKSKSHPLGKPLPIPPVPQMAAYAPQLQPSSIPQIQPTFPNSIPQIQSTFPNSIPQIQSTFSNSKRLSQRFTPSLSPILESARRPSLPTQSHQRPTLRHSTSLPSLVEHFQVPADVPPVPPLPGYLQQHTISNLRPTPEEKPHMTGYGNSKDTFECLVIPPSPRRESINSNGYLSPGLRPNSWSSTRFSKEVYRANEHASYTWYNTMLSDYEVGPGRGFTVGNNSGKLGYRNQLSREIARENMMATGYH